MKAKFNPKNNPIKNSINAMTAMVNSPRKNITFSSTVNSANNVEFTEDDYLLIDWVHQDQSGPKGDFTRKVNNKPCCWKIHYIIRTIPGVYFSTPELEEETLKTIDTEFDEFELFYTHQAFCDYKDIGPITAHILNAFLDSGTHLLAAQAKLIPVSIADFLKEYGKFGSTIDSNQPYTINFEWDPSHPKNWDFFQRPLTSTPYPYTSK